MILNELNPYNLKNHFILFSSGTTSGDLKGYALSRNALFSNAKAVNEHFNLTKDDTWALSLPLYHVGGLSVLCRAYLLGNNVVDARIWNPHSWFDKMQDVTITTLVPTQLYDLVKNKIPVPRKLKYLIIGGDLLNSSLQKKALELGWPIITTFGMSEVSSQLASTKTVGSPSLEILSIHNVKIKNQILLVKSPSLFTLEFTFNKSLRVKMLNDLCDEDGYYITKDRAEMNETSFIHLGRTGDDIKISGHLVNLKELRNTFDSYMFDIHQSFVSEIIFEDDERKGKKIVITSTEELSSELRNKIQEKLLPIKIDEFRKINHFDRTILGKLKK